MKLNEKDKNYIHYKAFYGDNIDVDKFESLKCENCQKIIGKYSVSDHYGFMAICNECLKNAKS